jgi:hypothetical protein
MSVTLALTFGLFVGLAGPIRAETISGTIQRDLRGVMHPLSCHCFNVAIFRETSGKEVPICFPDKRSHPCQELLLSGQFRKHTNNPERTSSCTRDTVRLFFVEKFDCISQQEAR